MPLGNASAYLPSFNTDRNDVRVNGAYVNVTNAVEAWHHAGRPSPKPWKSPTAVDAREPVARASAAEAPHDANDAGPTVRLKQKFGQARRSSHLHQVP